MSSNSWDRLFASFSERRRSAHKAAERDRERTRELLAWYDEQTHLVMTLLRDIVHERAAAFKTQSGTEVEVRCPSHPPINVDPDGPFMSFMSLCLDGREVHLYSHRIGCEPPMIHFVQTRRGEMARGLVSRPGCRIERREHGGFLLRALGTAGEGHALSVDDLAFRAFELLLNDR